MVLKIRLARFGKRHNPFYNIVLTHARTARNSRPLEVLGTYDPIPKTTRDDETRPFKDIRLDVARARYWLGVGAQPSDPAWRLLSMAGLLPPKFRVGQRAGPPVTIEQEVLVRAAAEAAERAAEEAAKKAAEEAAKEAAKEAAEEGGVEAEEDADGRKEDSGVDVVIEEGSEVDGRRRVEA